MPGRLDSRSIALALVASTFALPAAQAADARGEGILVTTTAEAAADGQCSLREAIQAANTNAPVDGCPQGQVGLDTIRVPAGTYTLALPGPGEDSNATGDLDITENVIIEGLEPIRGAEPRGEFAGPDIRGDGSDRVFDVQFGASARLENLSISLGSLGGVTVRTRGSGTDELGGGIRALGGLAVERCQIAFNRALGTNAQIARGGGGDTPASPARGGGIWALGPLSITDTSFLLNVAQGGEGTGILPGAEATGGAVYAVQGPVTMRGNTFFANRARGGAAGSSSQGGLASGGAIHLSNGLVGSSTIEDTEFTQNSADGNTILEPTDADGLAVDGIAAGGITPAGLLSPDALGGALYMGGGVVTVNRSLFNANQALGGPGPDGGFDGGDGLGGAIHHAGGALTVASSTFANGVAAGGDGGAFGLTEREPVRGVGDVGGSGGDGAGGAIFTTQPVGTITVLQSSFLDNTAIGGDGGAGQAPRGTEVPGGPGGDARGGHLARAFIPFRGQPPFTLSNTILAGGTVSAGTGGFGAPNGLEGSAVGAGCDAPSFPISSLLGNIESPTDTCDLMGGAGDLVSVSELDLDLGPLQDNGGRTRTALPGDGSDALDFAVLGNCPELDQRVWYRLDGTCDSGAADSGAFERVFGDDFETGNANAWTDTVGL